MRFTLSKRFRFEAAHFLPLVAQEHPCRRLHGHSYRIGVAVRGPVDPQTGWFVDYGELSHSVREVLRPLDHNLLNAVPGLENPTSELLAAWLWGNLKERVPGLARITVMETCQTRCTYEGPGAGGKGEPERC